MRLRVAFATLLLAAAAAGISSAGKIDVRACARCVATNCSDQLKACYQSGDPSAPACQAFKMCVNTACARVCPAI